MDMAMFYYISLFFLSVITGCSIICTWLLIQIFNMMDCINFSELAISNYLDRIEEDIFYSEDPPKHEVKKQRDNDGQTNPKNRKKS